MVLEWEFLNYENKKRAIREDLPTPLSPIRAMLNLLAEKQDGYSMLPAPSLRMMLSNIDDRLRRVGFKPRGKLSLPEAS